jgi:hypothetical protein
MDPEIQTDAQYLLKRAAKVVRVVKIKFQTFKVKPHVRLKRV